MCIRDRECMRSGIVGGTAAMVDGMLARIEEELEMCIRDSFSIAYPAGKARFPRTTGSPGEKHSIFI